MQSVLSRQMQQKHLYVCMYVYMYIYTCISLICTCSMYACMYIHTCYVLIQSAHTIYYVLAVAFASCFYVLFKFAS